MVVYGSGSGCTEGIARKIGETLEAAGLEAAVARVGDTPDPAGYDAVIVGSGVRAGRWHRGVREWVNAHSEALKARPTAFFTACLTMAQGPEKSEEVLAYTAPVAAESGVNPVDTGLFAGWNEPDRFKLPERLILKALKAPKGDFRDMKAVAAWTRAVARKLGVAA